MALAIWQRTIVDRAGNILPGASVEVRLESTGNLAALKADRLGAGGKSNPFTVGSDGFAQFFVVGGAYQIAVTSGVFSDTWSYVPIGTAQEEDHVPNPHSLMKHIPYAMRSAVRDYTSTDDLDDYIQEAIDACDDEGSGTLLIPNGKLHYASPLNISDKVGLRLVGASGINQALDGTRGSVLIYTGAAGTGRGIDLRRSKGCALVGLNLGYSSQTFDGDLVDMSVTGFATHYMNEVRGCTLYQTTGTSRTARSLLNLRHSIHAKIDFNFFGRAQYAIVGAAAAPVTVTIASPGVVTWTSHGLATNDPVSFSTTGALPTGITANTTYFVKTILGVNTFTISATAGGVVINTSGSQSGVHTGTEVWSSSVAADICNNWFVYCEKAAIANPGLLTTINKNIFEPTSAGAPAGIVTIGSNQAVRVSIDDNMFTDANVAGEWIKLGYHFACTININSIAGDDVNAIKGVTLGAGDGLVAEGNYFSGIHTGFTLAGSLVNSRIGPNQYSNLMSTRVAGADFGDDSCEIVDDIASLTAVELDDTTRIWDESAKRLKRVTQINYLAPATFIHLKQTVNFNSANTDNAFTITLPAGFTRWLLHRVTISGASASLTTATCSVWTAAGGTGTDLVASATAITVSATAEDTANNLQSLALQKNGNQSHNQTTIYFRVQTAQGSAATATVEISYTPVS